MNVIKKFTLKSLKNNKKWTIVTIIGIIISTAMITAVFTLTDSFLDLMKNSTIEEKGNWHAAFYDINLKDEELIKQNKNIEDYMIKSSVGYAKLEGSQNSNKPYVYIEQYNDESMNKFPIHLISGRLPQNDKEIIISQHIETNGGVKYNIGDELTLSVGKRMNTNGQELMQNEYYQETETFFPEDTLEYKIVGIMGRPEFESRWSPGYTVISYFDKNNYLPEDNVDIYILLNKLNNSFQEKVSAIANEIGIDESDVGYNTDLLRYYGIMESDNVRYIIFIFALVMVIIIMVASISLIYNAFAISVSERIKQLGMLASIGATKKQKRENVYFEGFLVGLIGIPLGIIAGIAGIGITIRAVSPLLNDSINIDYIQLKMVISPTAIMITALFAIVTIFISVYIPAKRASKIMPIDAIRQSKEVKMTSKNIKTSKLAKTLFGFEGEIAMKNLKRSKKKYRATIISLTISIVLFLSVSTVIEYTNKSTEIRLDTEKLNFDASLTLPNLNEEKKNKIFNSIIGSDFVDDYGIVRQFNRETLISNEFNPDIEEQINLQQKNGKYVYTTKLTAIGDEAFKKYVASIGGNIDDFIDPLNPQVILVNKAVSYLPEEKKYVESEAVKLNKGDSISLEYYKIDADDKTSPSEDLNLKISNVTDEMPIGTYTSQFGDVLVITSDIIFDSITTKTQDLNDTNTMLAVKTTDGEKLDTQIQQIFKDNGINNSDVFMFNSSVDAKMQKRISIVMGVFIYGFITLISLICIANIFNTVSTNIALRRKEFAMLRSVGMTPKSFNKMMNFESVFYGIKALLYGIPISVAIGFFLYKTLNDTISFNFTLPWKNYGVAVIFVFIIVAATMLYSSSKIRKQNIIDALKDDSF
nr:FtsX-like permease family protein [Sedimentibacter sp.]